MATALPRSCRIEGCDQGVPPTLAQEALCLDHYIETALTRLRAALELCQQGKEVDSRTLDWLVAGADFAVQSLAQNGFADTPARRSNLLELLLCLANLHEYLRHHSIHVKSGY